ncbi:MAG: GDSL-type esterase/lipase family protein [Planctomycetota bacterium]
MIEDSDEADVANSASKRRDEASRAPLARLTRIGKSVARTAVVAFSLLSFPSVLPWMVAFWIACHTVLAKWNRPAWVPLAICLGILVVKLVPRTPAMMVLCVALAVVSFLRYRRRHDSDARPRWWAGAIVLWLAWMALSFEWRAIERCSQSLTLNNARPIVCIGDSLTEGMLPDRGYPDQLKSMVSVPVINLGFSGIATSQGVDQMERVLKHNPQVVVIELGGHDFLKGHGRAATKRNLLSMIEQCRANNAEVILMEIPRGFIFDPYASLEREIAYEQDVQLVPDTWLRQIVLLGPAAPPGMWIPEYRLSDDGIHSNPRGSKAIAKRVAKALKIMYGDEILSHQ